MTAIFFFNITVLKMLCDQYLLPFIKQWIDKKSRLFPILFFVWSLCLGLLSGEWQGCHRDLCLNRALEGKAGIWYTVPQGLVPLNFKELDELFTPPFFQLLPSGEIDRLEVIISQTLNLPLFCSNWAPRSSKGLCLQGELQNNLSRLLGRTLRTHIVHNDIGQKEIWSKRIR